MDLVKVKSPTNSSIVQANRTIPGKSSKKQKILTEDEYEEKMEKIITRDFFPDLPKLKVQNAYLDAVEQGDIGKIQQLQMTYQLTQSSYGSVRETGSTPSVYNNPEAPGSPTLSIVSKADDTVSVFSESGTKQSLDEFLSNTTSEDNASFEAVMEKDNAAHREKYPWLYKDEAAELKKVSDLLALPSPDKPAIEGKKPELVMWAYKNQNSLMYVPQGADLTPEERLKMATNRKEIRHCNTRFEAPPFDEDANKEAIAEAAALQAKMREGRVGIDGKELNPDESPQVNGYGFVGTPAPAPGVSDTPIMTWGEIEGTPFRLDGGDTPLRQTPGAQQFKIPGPSAREQIAFSLADKAAQKHRKSKSTTPLRNFGSTTPKTPLEKLYSMSPAAQRLAYSKLGIQRHSDSALRASYSPLHTPEGSRTPVTPTIITPVSTPKNATPVVVTHTQADLMRNVPKRQKASDFF